MTDKPKRKYTVTPRVLAAVLANLAKANAVPKSIRYRSTVPRLLACRANLTLAVAARRADWSARYAPNFRLGVYALSLPRSLAAAGESEAEYERHLELFARGFAPIDKTEAKLVRAMAKVWWRRLRALRLQSRWETHRLRARLDYAAYLADLGLAGKNRDGNTALELYGVFVEQLPLLTTLDRLSRRFERLARVLIERRADPGAHVGFWLRRHASESWMEEQLEVLLENPFLQPSTLERRIDAELREPAVSAVTGWTWRTPEDEGSGADGELSGMSGSTSDQASPGSPASGDAPAATPTDATPASEFAAHLDRIVRAFPEPKRKRTGADSTTNSIDELRQLAALTWARQRIFGAEADCETAFLKEALSDAALDLSSRTAKLLTRLDDDSRLFNQVRWLSASVNHALDELQVKRYGRSGTIDEFQAEERGTGWEKEASAFLEAMDEAQKAVSSA